MKLRHAAIGIAAIAFAGSAFASKPTSITYVEEKPLGDQVYAHYQVKCTDGSVKDITAWDERREWCQGLGERTDCSRKQIKAAKDACK